MGFVEYAASVRRRWRLVLAAAVGGALAGLLLVGLTAPSYRSTTTLFVGSTVMDPDQGAVSAAGLQEVALDALPAVARSGPVLAAAAERLGPEWDARRVRAALEVQVPEDTSLVEIAASAPSAREAALLAGAAGDAVRRELATRYATDGGDPLVAATTMAPAHEPAAATAPDRRRSVALGGAAGAALAVLAAGLAAPRRRAGATDEGGRSTVAAPVGSARDLFWSRAVAVPALGLLGLAHPLPMAATSGLLVTVGLLPVWARVLPRYRGAVPMVVLAALALCCGLLLTRWSSADHDFAPYQAAETTLLVVTAVGGVGLLLWARTVLPLPAVAMAYGLGYLAHGILRAPGSDNAWKFELSLPVTIVVLALVAGRRRPAASLAALAALAALGLVNVLNDSRSAFGFCVIAAVLVVWQARPRGAGRRTNRWAGAALVGGLAAGGYVAMTELLLSGLLGAEIQARSATHIAQSGSLLLGGRPEWTATWALMQHNPLGFGLGTVPTAEEVLVAKAGMAVVNNPTVEGYIENYMFAGRFELHSIVADLWADLGPVGLLLGLVMAGLVARSCADLLGHRRAPALLCFLAPISLWFLAFGTLSSNLLDVAMALGVLLQPRRTSDGPDASRPSDEGREDRRDPVTVPVPVGGGDRARG